jgi:hypothetical protein
MRKNKTYKSNMGARKLCNSFVVSKVVKAI